MSKDAAALAAELKHESSKTRTTLERIPEDRLDWSPHDRSWSFRELGSHIANLGYWMVSVLDLDEIDLATLPPESYKAPSVAELLSYHDGLVEQALGTLGTQTDETMAAKWTLRSGDHVILEMSRLMAIRFFIYNHLIHHRGQLSVYLRLCDVPVPAIYGPSADEESFGS